MSKRVKYRMVAIPAKEADLEAAVHTRFAKAPYYAIYHHDSLEFTFHKNTALDGSGNTGVKAARQLAQLDIDAVLVPNIGAKAFQVLKQKGVTIYRYTQDYSVRDALYDLYEEQLAPVSQSSQTEYLEE